MVFYATLFLSINSINANPPNLFSNGKICQFWPYLREADLKMNPSACLVNPTINVSLSLYENIIRTKTLRIRLIGRKTSGTH
jgi:hypothetical protein